MSKDLVTKIAQVQQSFEQLEYKIAQGMKPAELDSALIEVNRTIELLQILQNDMEKMESVSRMHAMPAVDKEPVK